MEERASWKHNYRKAEEDQDASLKEEEVRKARQQPEPRAGGDHNPSSIQQTHVPIMTVLFMTVAMAGAAGIGSLPFFFIRSLSRSWAGVATAVACGVMLAASFDLIHEGQPYGALLVVFGVGLGAAFIKWSSERLDAYEDIQFAHLKGSRARKTFLMVAIMAAHALGEGCGVGVSFVGDKGWTQGVLTTLAIGVHNIPEGLAKATVLVGQGMSAWDALLWSIITCLPQPLVAVPSFIFVESFKSILPIALGFAAGCMIWMVFAELLPDALHNVSGGSVATSATLAAAGLEGIRMLFESMATADGVLNGSSIGSASSWSDAIALGCVLVPAVALAGLVSSVLTGTSLQPPLALGVGAAITACLGLGTLFEQVLFKPRIPITHAFAGASSGVVLVLVLRRQILLLATSMLANGKHHDDIESMDGVVDDSGAMAHSNGPAYHYSGSKKESKYTKRSTYILSKMMGPQFAACGVTLVALLAFNIAYGLRIAQAFSNKNTTLTQLVFPVSLGLALRGGGVGAVMASGMGATALGGFLGGAIVCGTSLVTACAAVIRGGSSSTYDFPYGWACTVEGMAAGALCMGSFVTLAVGMSLHPRRARGGFVIALLPTITVWVLTKVLCFGTACLPATDG